MFERFSHDAREIIAAAYERVADQNAQEINNMDVLAALLRFPASGAGRLLVRLGVALEDVGAEVQRVRRRGGITEADARALGEFGIEVDHIVDRIEQIHGANAIANARKGPGHPRRIPLADDSKKTLEVSLKEVVRLGARHLGSEHILLALAILRGPAADILARFDIDAHRLRNALLATP